MVAHDMLVHNLLKIDFGDITGEGDPKLFDYFLNDNYWDKIINNKVFFVTGRKGTGKSTIYRFLEKEAANKGAIVTNSDCAAFPFEKLLRLSDDDFSRPNQYQSIWKNIVLSYFISQISLNNLEEYDNLHYLEIKKYYQQFLGNGEICNLHKDIVQKTQKTSLGLQNPYLSAHNDSEESSTFSLRTENISQINEKLFSLIVNFFIATKNYTKYIIQFDRLDDNYNLYQKKTEYYDVILCLCKVAYSINQSFREKNIDNAKIIVYLRSDIIRKINERDAESARFSDFIYELQWAIINKNDWINPRLLQMINRRIEASNMKGEGNFEEVFPNNYINLRNQQDVFQYIVNRSFHRPRDLVKFCKLIREEAVKTGLLYYRTVKDAEKKYSQWFLFDELANEINPILNDKVDATHQLLRMMGREPFSLESFKIQYDKSQEKILSNHEVLLKYLYQVGIVFNTGKDQLGRHNIRSIVRNDSEWRPEMLFQIFTPIWTALNV